MNIKYILATLVLCLITYTAFCQKNGATITIDIRPLKTDTLLVVDGNEVIFAKPGKNGKYTFNFKSDLPKTVEFSIKKRGRMPLYIEEGNNLNVATDFGNKMVFSGTGANNTRVYYQNFSFLNKTWRAITVKGGTPDDLYAQFDAMFKKPIQTLKANKDKVTASFYKNHLDFLYYQDLGYKLDVPFWYRRETGKKLSESIPDGYWDMLKQVKLNDKVLKTAEYQSTMFSSFPQFLENEYKFKSGKPDSTFNDDDVFIQTYRRIEELTGGLTRARVLAARIEYKLSTVKDPGSVRPLLDEYIQKYNMPENAENIKALQKQYQQIDALAPGKVPSPFVLKDGDGKSVTLKDFAGKVIYMDFWASWCAPCRAQMKAGAPKLHKLFGENKDVVFLYINLDKMQDLGKKAIAEDKIEGIHLFAGDFNRENPITRAFNISGIPRYVIIGRDGKIFDVDAPRPSDDTTPGKINEALRANL
jgi:thiol-disulfide isomerase/thioredoxin